VGVGQHNRVVVYAHDPRLRVGLLGDSVHVRRARDASADIEELPHPRLADQVPDGTAQEITVGPNIRPGAVQATGQVCVRLDG
jgi:hypothetical protein